MFAARQQGMRATGTTTSVSNDDISRLSYYLSCATKGIGLDILPDELIEYQRARFLSRDKKDVILKLAYEVFDTDTTVGKIFYPDQRGLCGDSDNEFYEITQVDTLLAVDSSFVIGGQNKQVAKIMVFKQRWIDRNYHTPIRNQMSRIRQICDVKDDAEELSTALAGLLIAGLAAAVAADDSDDDNARSSSSNHCSHCRGFDGNCACKYGCPIKPSTKCSRVHHCDHCRGFEGKCACKQGCAEGMHSKCWVEHSGVTCDGCGNLSSIRGSRFKCTQCANYDLCEKCYNQGARKHDMTHAFRRCDREGSEWVWLSARQSRPPPPPAPPTPSTPPRPSTTYSYTKNVEPHIVDMPPEPTARATPIAHATPVYDSSPASVAHATFTPTVSTSGFSVGDSVKLVGLKAQHMNGVAAVVERDAPMAGGRVQVRLKEHEPNKLMCIKPENLQKVNSFQTGQMVALTGLDDKSKNGIVGMVESSVPGGRVMVRLYEGKTVSIKPENLEVVADILD